MNTKTELLNFISESSLNEQDKGVWHTFLDAQPDSALEIYSEIFSAFPGEVSWFNEIMKRKMTAMAKISDGNKEGEEEMKEIAQEEKEKINNLIENI